jgi:hypothetical protein
MTAGTFAQGGAGGHDVVDEQYAFARSGRLALKSAAHVAGWRSFMRQFGLRRGGSVAIRECYGQPAKFDFRNARAISAD